MAVMVFVILGLDEILGGSLVFPLSITAKPFSVSAKSTLSLSATVQESIIVPFGNHRKQSRSNRQRENCSIIEGDSVVLCLAGHISRWSLNARRSLVWFVRNEILLYEYFVYTQTIVNQEMRSSPTCHF